MQGTEPDSNEKILSRAELQELQAKYREMKHSINNMFAVVMALSELGQRNPAHLEKLAKAVLERSPEVVRQLTTFGDALAAKLKGDAAPTPSPLAAAFASIS
jgi:hypothetical protein